MEELLQDRSEKLLLHHHLHHHHLPLHLQVTDCMLCKRIKGSRKAVFFLRFFGNWIITTGRFIVRKSTMLQTEASAYFQSSSLPALPSPIRGERVVELAVLFDFLSIPAISKQERIPSVA